MGISGRDGRQNCFIIIEHGTECNTGLSPEIPCQLESMTIISSIGSCLLDLVGHTFFFLLVKIKNWIEGQNPQLNLCKKKKNKLMLPGMHAFSDLGQRSLLH